MKVVFIIPFGLVFGIQATCMLHSCFLHTLVNTIHYTLQCYKHILFVINDIIKSVKLEKNSISVSIIVKSLLFCFIFAGLFSVEQNQTFKMKSTIESGSFDFSLRLYKLLSSPNNNLIVSPFSVSNALAMVNYGARDKTAAEISRVIFGREISEDHFQLMAQEFNDLVNKNVKANSEVLNVANFLYSHHQFNIHSEYKDALVNYFNAKATELDFQNGGQAINKINGDVSIATKGKIDQLFDSIDPMTRMILVNAIYFKGLWKSQFKKDATKKDNFYLTNGNSVQIDMMFQNSKYNFGYNEQLKFKALEIPYENSNTSLLLLLPDEGNSIEDLEDKLTVELINDLLNNKMENLKVEVYLPKFKLSSTLHLIPSLAKLGMKDLFSVKDANFSGITNEPTGLYVGDVIQKAVIEVNEEGTEAAAATGVVFLTRTVMLSEEFRANRPFIFMLLSKYDNDKRLTLFMGALKQPKLD